jgi:Fe-S oxidoreductase
MKIDFMSKQVYFNPSCSLELYRPEYDKMLFGYLKSHFPNLKHHDICCRKDPKLQEGSVIINVCTGCDKRWSELYSGITTVSLYRLIDIFDDFPFPDHSGLIVTIHDSCPVRGDDSFYDTVRSLLKKMHVTVVEAEFSREKSLCCGYSVFSSGNKELIQQMMRKSADSLPLDNVLVYCVTCMKVMAVSGKKPYYLLDLLLDRNSDQRPYDLNHWNSELDAYKTLH